MALAYADSRYGATLRWWTPIVARHLAADRALVTHDRNACLLWRYSDEHLPDAPGQPSMREMLAQLIPPERLGEVKAALAVFPRLRRSEATPRDGMATGLQVFDQEHLGALQDDHCSLAVAGQLGVEVGEPGDVMVTRRPLRRRPFGSITHT